MRQNNLHDTVLQLSSPSSIRFAFALHRQLFNSTSNSCLIPTQQTKVIRPHPSDNDVQPHTKPSCCWSQSDVCKWIIQYIEVVNGIIRGEQTFKLSAYQARWEDTSSCVCKCITYTTWIVTSVYPRESGGASPSGMHLYKRNQNNQENLRHLSKYFKSFFYIRNIFSIGKAQKWSSAKV